MLTRSKSLHDEAVDVAEYLQGMGRQVARTDHQLTEVSDMVAAAKKDIDMAMQSVAKQSAQVMDHVDAVKGSVQTAQSLIEARIFAIESRLSFVEYTMEKGKKNVVEELDGNTASVIQTWKMEVQKLGSNVQDIGRRLGEAEVACREAQKLDHRVGEVETICRQATLMLSKVTECRDDRNGIQRRFSAWYSTVDHHIQQAGEMQRSMLSETSLTCEPHVEPDACLDMRLPNDRSDRSMSTMGPAPAAESTLALACAGAANAPEERSKVSRRGIRAFPVQVAIGRMSARLHENCVKASPVAARSSCAGCRSCLER